MIEQFDVVRLAEGLPDEGLPPGTQATVLEVYTDPPGYEVEVVDDNGETLFLGSVEPDQVEAIWSGLEEEDAE